MNDKRPIQSNEHNLPRFGRDHQDCKKPTSSDRMQPALLDILTDDEPKKRQEVHRHNLVSHGELRRRVLRDLQWLFNCINNESGIDFGNFPYARRSTLNYGIASLAGKRMSDIEWLDIEHALTDSILHFEPRILPTGLRVRCLSDIGSLELHNILSIEIKGRLWCVPNPLDFLFRTDVDLENGRFDLKDIG